MLTRRAAFAAPLLGVPILAPPGIGRADTRPRRSISPLVGFAPGGRDPLCPEAGLSMTHVPFRGTGQAVNGILAGAAKPPRYDAARYAEAIRGRISGWIGSSPDRMESSGQVGVLPPPGLFGKAHIQIAQHGARRDVRQAEAVAHHPFPPARILARGLEAQDEKARA